MRTWRHTLRIAAGLACQLTAATAQERAGEADIGFQQYSLTSGSRRVASAFGLTLGMREFIPNVGIVSVSLAPAASAGRFRTGDMYMELKRFPWIGQYWTFRGGDFRVPAKLLEAPFNNLYYPEISGRGAWMEASHGGRTFGILYGTETLQAGVRVPLRLETPQTMAGVYFRQQAGERLVLGARILTLSNDLGKLRKTTVVPVPDYPLSGARTAAFSALYTVAGRLKWYGEAVLSQASRETPDGGTHGGPLSVTVGPALETKRVTARANYIYQTESYLPLLGYYLGDRRGPYGEVKVRPFSWLDLYGSVSDYTNNVARDSRRPTFHGTTEAAGASLQLPGRFSLGGQWSAIKLATRKSGADPWESGESKQVQVTLSKPVRRHSLRLGLREFKQSSQFGPQRQRTAEAADSFQYRWFSLGAEVRAQQSIGQQRKMSVFVRTNGQVNVKRLSAFANLEIGNDLANRTLFTTSTMSTKVVGGTVRLGRDWDFSVEAFRNNLITELNRQNVFLLQGQGVYVPSVLPAFNQWSVYYRMTKHIRWGKAMPPNTPRLESYAIGQNQLKGSVEGFVKAGESRWVEGIPVALDGRLTVLTDAKGRFRFENVAEGARKVGLALNELPADYDPGANVESTVWVKPGKASRADFSVVAVGYAVQGVVRGPAGVALGTIVLKLLPSGRYTTPDNSGRFSFFNVKEGSYEIALAEEMLPQHAVLKTPGKMPVTVGFTPGGQVHPAPQVQFEFDVRVPPKPVRKVAVPSRAEGTVGPTTGAEPPKPARNIPPPPAHLATAGPASPPIPDVESQLSAAEGAELHARGRDLIKGGDYRGAVAVLTGAIKAKGNFPMAYNARGYATLRLMKYKEAVADLDMAIRLNPAYRNAYQNRAAAKKAMGDLAGARADLDTARTLR
ncbi:MAG: hypothetical protein ACKV2U_10615 [Bryobacteraceae bacterium]